MTENGRRILEVGDSLETPPRLMTRERMRWYCDALETAAAADGTFRIADPTIHTDDEYARAQGLPGIIADGMISTNWISGMLYRYFGVPFLADGELTTTFIRPVYEDETIQARGKVTAVEESSSAAVYAVDVWCETADGDMCTVGSARVPVSDAVPGSSPSGRGREEGEQR